jgi:hypothetical protein
MTPNASTAGIGDALANCRGINTPALFGWLFFLNYRCVMTAHVTDRLVAFGSCGGMHGCLLFYAQFLPKGGL